MFHKLLLLFALLCSVIYTRAQRILFEHLNEKNGLSQNAVYSITQDHQGFIWMGTSDGLNRFDGYTFDIFRTDDKNTKSILPGKIINLHACHKDLVLLTVYGLSLFNTKTFESQNFLFPATLINPRIVFDTESNILVGADNGLFILNLSTGKFNATSIKDPVTSFNKVKQGVVSIGVSSGLFLYYPFNNKIVHIRYNPEFYIQDVTCGKAGELNWVEANGYVFTGIVKGNTVKIIRRIEIPSFTKCNSLKVYHHQLLAGSSDGLIKIDKDSSISIDRYKENEPYSLSNNKIFCVYVDHNENLWIGTGSGIDKFQPFRFKFPCAGPTISTKFNQLKEVLAFSQTKNGDLIYATGAGQIGLFNLKTNEIIEAHQTEITANTIVPVNTDSTLFLMGTPKGALTYNINTKTYNKLNTVNALKPFVPDIKFIVKVNNDSFWMAGADGLFLFDIKNGKTLSYFNIGNSRLGTNNIRGLLADENNKMYLATSVGLYLLNTSTQKLSLIKLTSDKKEPFISQICKDKKGNIWIGTIHKGIFKLNYKGSIEKINTDDGLSNNNIYGIIADDKKNEIWISSNAGLTCYRPFDKSINNYDLADGLQGNEFIESSLFKTREGLLVFGGMNGFNFFNPDDIKNDNASCPVAIKNMLLFNKTVPYSNYYVFDYQQNYITIEYVALDFHPGGSNQYFYKMEGLQQHWIEAGNRRFAGFGQLQPGNYTFKVKATNGDGKLSLNQAEIHFSIIPPFWLTWWFRAAFILILSGGIALFIYFRVNNVILEEQEKTHSNKMIAELELKALRAQMNPHFIFNSLNSIQDFVLNNEGIQAAKYLSKFAKLMRMILDLSEHPFVNIQQKITFIKLYVELESLRMNNNFSYEFEIDEAIDKDGQIPTLLIQPYIENAIWHGLQYKDGAKKLTIRLKKSESQMLVCEVEDNGIGRQAALAIKQNKTVHHQSMGLKITEERMKILKRSFGSIPRIEIYDLTDRNNVACGTRVILKIPVKNG